MIYQTLLLFTLFTKSNDTLLLPVTYGVVKNDTERFELCGPRMSATIYPTTSFEVKSCSSGIVAYTEQKPGDRSTIVVRTGSLVFVYILDLVNVQKGETVKTAQVIGKLRNTFPDSANDDNSLLFLVMNKDRELNPKKFLKFRR